jgi:leucine dehydrogenase
VVTPEEILGVVCDVLSPNAGGEVVDARARDLLRCRAVCGAANNALASPEDREELDRRGILYAPDFVVNAGGVLSLLLETGALDADGTVRRVERIGADLAELLAAAEAERIAPFRLAEQRVEAKLAAARSAAATGA